MSAVTTLSLELTFSATHQILIAGVIEENHGHDFRCIAEVAVTDERDAALLAPVLRGVLSPLQHTDLSAVRDREGGHPSAERIARYLYRELSDALATDSAATLTSVTLHESPGCSATYRNRAGSAPVEKVVPTLSTGC